MKRKVLMLLTNPFRPDPRVYNEALALIENGYDVSIFCWDRDGKYPQREVLDGINVVRFHISSSYANPGEFLVGLFKFYFRVLRVVRKQTYEIVHANDFDTLPLAFVIKKLMGTALVYDAHDHYSSMIKDVISDFLASIISRFEKFLLPYVDVKIAATNSLGRLIFGKNFYTIMNAKDLKDYNVSEEKIIKFREQINPENKFLIVYIGILKLWTPLPYIISAVKNIEKAKLIIGGDGPHKKEILKMIEGVDNIKYVGWVNKKDIPIYTLSADAIVLPSDASKEYTRVAVPNKLLEGIAAGKSIIAGKGTAGEDLVNECRCGMVCEFGDVECLIDKIERLIKDKGLKEFYEKNAKKCAMEKYNWDIMKRKLIEAYSTIG